MMDFKNIAENNQDLAQYKGKDDLLVIFFRGEDNTAEVVSSYGFRLLPSSLYAIAYHIKAEKGEEALRRTLKRMEDFFCNSTKQGESND